MTRWLEPSELALQRGAEIADIELRERRSLMRQWRETFAGPVKEKTGKWVYLNFDWHAFSWNFSRCLQGARAVQAYLAEPPSTVSVVPHDERQPAFTCGSAVLVDFSECLRDIYVFPENLSWTIAFTHEQPEIGPFFSRAEWCCTPAG